MPAQVQVREREVRERRRSMKRLEGVMRRRVEVVSLARSGILGRGVRKAGSGVGGGRYFAEVEAGEDEGVLFDELGSGEDVARRGGGFEHVAGVLLSVVGAAIIAMVRVLGSLESEHCRRIEDIGDQGEDRD